MGRRHRRRSRIVGGILVACLSLFLAGWPQPAAPTVAQIDAFLPDLSLPTLSQNSEDGEEPVKAACVRMDGYCTFRVASPRSDLYPRVRSIEAAIARFRSTFVSQPDPDLTIKIQQEPTAKATPAPESSGGTDAPEQDHSENASEGADAATTPPRSPEIYIAIGDRKPQRLMSVNRFDANLKGVDVESAAESFKEQIRDGLERARQERTPQYLLRQLGFGGLVTLALLILSWVLGRWENKLRRRQENLRASLQGRSQSLHDLLTERQRWNIAEAQLRFSQLLRGVLWLGGVLFILSRFPYSRIITIRIIDGFRIPVRLSIVALGIYVVIRLSFAMISRLTSVLASSYDITPEINRRLQLRVKTISRVSRGMVMILWLGLGGLVALSAIGINIGPLLAGAGIIGLALSLPAQSLIKDAINGFFIILEDQYAVGDVITIHDIRGMVENINLRITQIRDEEGRLVTIPNSEIKLIANHSSHWSQADIYIPISYHTNVDQVLKLIERTGEEMKDSHHWSDAMLREPEVLGVEEFGERGLMIRVWIKTQPLKQWDVAREYRRRLKVALDAEGIVIPAHIDFKAPSR